MAGSVATGVVKPIFESLTYGPALEGEGLAKAWISKHSSHFGFFTDGAWSNPDGRDTFETKNVYSGEVLASIKKASDADVKSIVASSNKGFTSWSNTSHFVQSAILYSVARNLQKHQSLLAVIEALDTGRLAKDVRSVDVPAAIRSFYHNAGWATLKDEELSSWKPLGTVAIVVDASCPLMQLSNRIAAALAMGNAVILCPSTDAPLSAFLLGEICAQAGLPSGVMNVLAGMSPDILAANPGVNCVSYAGKREGGQALRQASAGLGTQMSLELHGRNPILVMEDADVDSAVEGIVEAAFSGAGQSNTCGSRLLVQEPIFDKVITRLKARMSKLAMGNNLDKNTDVGPLMDARIVKTVSLMLAEAEREGAEVFKACVKPEEPNFLPPILVTNEQTSSVLYVNELPAPILLAVPFRTVKEGTTIANHSMYGLNASVWCENINVALEAAALLNAGTVWINCQNCRDAAAGVGGNKNSGYGRIGGKDGLLEFAQQSFQSPVPKPTPLPLSELKKFGSSSPSSSLLPDCQAGGQGDGALHSIDKTYKMFYGGAQKRPESNSYKTIAGSDGKVCAYIPDAGKKDVRNAVDAALKAAPGWKKKEGHGKAQIMYYMAENLQGKRQEVLAQLKSKGKKESDAVAEFEATVQRLFYWAAWCDKNGGSVEETPLYGLTVKMNGPVGVIGIVCPDDFPLLAFVSLVAPAIARGNAVVVVPSGENPVPGLAFHQILETSDVPAGVVNILTGGSDVLTKTLTEHHDVNALWYFGTNPVGSQFVEHGSVENFKRTWVSYGRTRDWLAPTQGQGEEFLYHSTNSKTVWIPMGDIFAN